MVAEPVPRLHCLPSGEPVIRHSEWVRIFLGRMFAPGAIVHENGVVTAVEYLVQGRERSEPQTSEFRRDASSAVNADFVALLEVLNEHRRRIDAARTGDCRPSPELLLAVYAVLRRVTVSNDPRDWLVTDEGLSIVRWGLDRSGWKPILEWTQSDLESIRQQVRDREGLERTDDAARDAARRRVAEHSAAWVAADAATSSEPRPVSATGQPGAGSLRAGAAVRAGADPRESPDRRRQLALPLALVALALCLVLLVTMTLLWWFSPRRDQPTPAPRADSVRPVPLETMSPSAGSGDTPVAVRSAAAGPQAPSGVTTKQSVGESALPGAQLDPARSRPSEVQRPVGTSVREDPSPNLRQPAEPERRPAVAQAQASAADSTELASGSPPAGEPAPVPSLSAPIDESKSPEARSSEPTPPSDVEDDVERLIGISRRVEKSGNPDRVVDGVVEQLGRLQDKRYRDRVQESLCGDAAWPECVRGRMSRADYGIPALPPWDTFRRSIPSASIPEGAGSVVRALDALDALRAAIRETPTVPNAEGRTFHHARVAGDVLECIASSMPRELADRMRLKREQLGGLQPLPRTAEPGAAATRRVMVADMLEVDLWRKDFLGNASWTADTYLKRYERIGTVAKTGGESKVLDRSGSLALPDKDTPVFAVENSDEGPFVKVGVLQKDGTLRSTRQLTNGTVLVRLLPAASTP